jgi:hypothetical protein
MSNTRKVEYIGYYSGMTVPFNPGKIVRRGDIIEVPADLKLPPHNWRDVVEVNDEDAPIKDGE